MRWDPDRYSKFKDERAAPFEDLMRLIDVRDGMRVIDLGCGTGELTRQVMERLPNSTVVGVDASADMLGQAQNLAGPRLRFELNRIEKVSGKWDLIFSNAALHWLGNHRVLIPRLLSFLNPRGQLAVQVPSNFDHPSHILLRAAADQEPFKRVFRGDGRALGVLSTGEYAELLFLHGTVKITAFEKVYPHVLADADEILEWMRGTALLAYLDRLPGEFHEPFIDCYRTKLWQQWPAGPVFYGFKRILFAGTRPSSLPPGLSGQSPAQNG